MAVINEVIPMQGFEVVLNKIASILFIEITNQIALSSLTDEVEVYIERMTPYDKSEDVLINVSCNAVSYGEFTQRDSEGNTTYFIDLYTRGTENDLVTGEANSRNKIHKYLSMVRYILSSVRYKTLDTGFGLVAGTYVNAINFDDNYGNQDGAYIRFARLTFGVRIMENQSMDIPIEFLGNDSVLKLSNTDKGQKLIFNN